MASRAYSRAGITQRLFNQPLAVMPETAAIVLGAVGPRLDVSQLFMATEGRTLSRADLEGLAANELARIDQARMGAGQSARGGIDRRARTMPAERLMLVHNGVAHIGIRGETVAENDGSIGPSSGFTGYDGLVAQVQAADADPAVRGILLDVDSPGGEVSGLFEAASVLMARRGTKPMRAMIRGMGCSAAYTLACTADEVTLHELGLAGSNGVITMHADLSAALAQDGIKVSLFTSGSMKGAGNPFEPLPETVAARIQTMVDTSAARLFAHVAEARGLTVEAVRAQQGQAFHGEEAVQAGLVDKIMGWQDSMDEFEAAVNGTGTRPAATAPVGARSAKGTGMSIEATAPAADQQPEFTQAALDAAVSTARTEASAQAATEAVTGERARISALAELDASSTISPALAAAISEGTSAGDFAIGLAKAAKTAGASALASAQAEALPADHLPESGAAAAAARQDGGALNRGAAFAAKKQAAR